MDEGKIRLEPQPPYAVVLHNDPINGFDYVVQVLQKVFGYGQGKAFLLTMRAHCLGRSTVWTGSLEVAELRAEQIVGCGPDPAQVSAGAPPLRVSVEPMPHSS
ncbi:MAG: ATP-dependent Clp protease adaptor ClpS [Armatimonadetes bacterium]|nr:ATP-dependent Clp protease adaptor ClpS [Armatimonadota bacterium]